MLSTFKPCKHGSSLKVTCLCFVKLINVTKIYLIICYFSVSKSSQISGSTIESQINGLKLNPSQTTPTNSHPSQADSTTQSATKTIPSMPGAPGYHGIPGTQPGRVVSIIKGVARPQSLASESTGSEAKTQEAMLKYASTKGKDYFSICFCSKTSCVNWVSDPKAW